MYFNSLKLLAKFFSTITTGGPKGLHASDTFCKNKRFLFVLGTLMCYGQTGAGKTFTMTGATENYKHRGLIPRALAQLYREVEESGDLAISVRYD